MIVFAFTFLPSVRGSTISRRYGGLTREKSGRMLKQVGGDPTMMQLVVDSLSTSSKFQLLVFYDHYPPDTVRKKSLINPLKSQSGGITDGWTRRMPIQSNLATRQKRKGNAVELLICDLSGQSIGHLGQPVQYFSSVLLLLLFLLLFALNVYT